RAALDQHRGRERAGGDEAGVAERDLTGQPRQRVERERTHGGERGLRDEVERERRGEAGQDDQRDDRGSQRDFSKPRVDQREIGRVRRLEVPAAERHQRWASAAAGWRERSSRWAFLASLPLDTFQLFFRSKETP